MSWHTQTALDFARLAAHKKVDALMLAGEDVEQLVLELVAVHVWLTGNGHGFAIAGGGVLLDEVLNLVVVDVICAGH